MFAIIANSYFFIVFKTSYNVTYEFINFHWKKLNKQQNITDLFDASTLQKNMYDLLYKEAATHWIKHDILK